MIGYANCAAGTDRVPPEDRRKPSQLGKRERGRLPAAKMFELTDEAVASRAAIAMIDESCVTEHGAGGLCQCRVAVLRSPRRR